MKNQSNKEVPSSSKLNVEETPQKRGRKAAPAIARPSLPKSMKYVIKTVPTHALRFGAPYNTNFLDEFKKSIGDVGIELFRATIFGPYLDIPKCNFQGQVTKCLLLLELEQDNTKVLHIRHANGSILNFGIKEFALITGLKCKGNTKDFAYPESTPCRLFQKYFPDAVTSISKSRLVQRFLMGNWENNQDALQMAILYFVHTFILTQTSDSSISIDEFLMVEDGSYQLYPLGQIAFSKLMNSLRQDFNLNKQMYRLYGMPYALNVWTYECASQVNPEIAVKERNVIPRICNWRVVVVKPKFGMLMSSIFTENGCSNIVPTPEELAAIDLPEDQHAPPSSPPSTSVNPKVVQSKDISGFEDFSTSPPEQLVRRSSRVSNTSSPPPPKRRKKVDTPKTKVSKPSQPDQCNVSLNQPFSIPDESPTPAANVHVYSDAQKVNSVISDKRIFEGLR